ncbi:hypothetical protein TNCV_3228141 [Trichonephila clavipes]|nr:hypothetical protein TNCV_3228141 [Trichonephila clavipes]
MAACVREYTLEFFTLLNAKGKKELIEWCWKEGLIASSYECPKCNDRPDVTWLHHARCKNAFFEIVPAMPKVIVWPEMHELIDLVLSHAVPVLVIRDDVVPNTINQDIINQGVLISIVQVLTEEKS